MTVSAIIPGVNYTEEGKFCARAGICAAANNYDNHYPAGGGK